MEQDVKQKAKDSALNFVLTVAPYVAGALVINQVGISMGLWDSRKTSKYAKNFRALPYLTPKYAQDNLHAISLQDLCYRVFDTNDLYKLNRVNKSVKDTYYAKGYIWDDEESAVRSIKGSIDSLIDLSIYSGIFSNYVQEPFINYLDSFLENRYQAELYVWIQKLPVLTVKQKSILEKRTGKKIVITSNKTIQYK